MRQIIIVCSLLLVVAAYFLVSQRERNYVNLLTPVVLIKVPSLYLLELVYQFLFQPEGSVYAYFYCYAAYALGFAAMAIGYLAFPAQRYPIFLRLPRIKASFAPWLVLLIGLLLYLPVLIQHADLIFSPREIYKATRTGFGINFFLSTFAVYFSFILLLFSRRAPRILLALFVAVALGVIYLHGSKGQLLSFFLIALYYLVFVKGWRFTFGRMIATGGIAALAMLVLFYVTLPSSMKEDMLAGMASYSDYTRNAAMVIDDGQLDPQFGRLTFESHVYTLVPRAVFPDKPKDFGAFWLAKRYYPQWFEADTGAPAFGLGVEYADFGPFAIVWHVFAQLLAGMFAKLLVTRLRTGPDPGTFVLLLPFLQVDLIPAGSGTPLIIFYVFGLLANVLSPKSVSTPAPAAAPAAIPA